MVRLVDGFGEDHSGGAASGCPSEGDDDGARDKRLVESLEVGITRLCHDGAKRVARLLEDGVSSDMRKGGRSARHVVRLM